MGLWEKTSAEKVGPDCVEIIVGAVMPGIEPAKSHFEVTYTDKESGREVTGRGDTLQEADEKAQDKI